MQEQHAQLVAKDAENCCATRCPSKPSLEILKLPRLQFGRRSEKRERQIEQTAVLIAGSRGLATAASGVDRLSPTVEIEGLPQVGMPLTENRLQISLKTPRKTMKRLDLLTAILAGPLVLAAAKSITALDPGNVLSLKTGKLKTPKPRIVNALTYGLREGRGRGANNATSLQRAIDDVSLTGGTILIPEGRYDIAAPISLKVRTDERPAKSIAIVGKGRAVLVTRADSVFTIVHSDGAQLGRITIRDMELHGNLA